MTPPCVACGTPLAADLDKAGHGLHLGCEALPISPDLVIAEMNAIIADAIINQPRSLQRRIGPSEIGIPCDRRIGYILASIPKVTEEDTVKWKPFVGTALHDKFEDYLAFANRDLLAAGNPFRWHVEERVMVGEINGVQITGSCDLFDGWTGLVIDHKFTSRNAIREKYRPHGPGEQYRVQAHLYGKGWKNRGFDVRNVGISFKTRDGEFPDAHFWSEPFDEAIADEALARATTIAQQISRETDNAFGQLATADAMCRWCPWYRKNATQISAACPGVGETQEQTLTNLIGA